MKVAFCPDLTAGLNDKSVLMLFLGLTSRLVLRGHVPYPKENRIKVMFFSF